MCQYHDGSGYGVTFSATLLDAKCYIRSLRATLVVRDNRLTQVTSRGHGGESRSINHSTPLCRAWRLQPLTCHHMPCPSEMNLWFVAHALRRMAISEFLQSALHWLQQLTWECVWARVVSPSCVAAKLMAKHIRFATRPGKGGKRPSSMEMMALVFRGHASRQ